MASRKKSLKGSVSRRSLRRRVVVKIKSSTPKLRKKISKVLPRNKKNIAKKTAKKIVRSVSTKKPKKIILKKASIFLKNVRASRKKLRQKKQPPKSRPVVLRRFLGNPILRPSEKSWETQATFNPGATLIDNKVHLVYRAIGNDDMSVFGYSTSEDGFHIDYRSPQPIYYAPSSFELFRPGIPRYLSPSGGGYGGCEDPRVVAIDDRVYLTFTSWNGYEVPRVALTSISLEDFLRKNWNWNKSVLISSPGQTNKNWVIFPEKINGKFAILHSITPDIQIDYFDNLDFDGKTFIKSRHEPKPRRNVWDSRLRGVGPPPIKTKDGWLIIYHAIDDRDPGRYKIGAMILDLKKPENILYRSKVPILSPDEVYENEGYKSGVIYSCGAVVIGNTLIVYYGGADTVGCVASLDLDEFLSELKSSGSPRLRKKVIYHES